MEKPLCISYIRFSSASQSDGSSLERQIELSRKYAEENGLILDNRFSYRDLGKSAYSNDHVLSGAFGEFLALVKAGKIPKGTVLLVESLDRLSRDNVLNAFEQFNTIIKEGIKVVTLCDKMVYTKDNLQSNFGAIIMSLTIMARANEESARKSERIRAAFKFKRNNLVNVKFTANCPSWLKLSHDRKSFEIIEERAALIRRIYDMSYHGQGIKTITRILNEEKISPPRSKLGWCQSSIRKILSNQAVIGKYQPNTYNRETKKYVPDGDVVKNYFPAILKDDVFYAVQARLNNGTHVGGRTAKIENLFGGITFCGYCGARMDIVTKHNRREIARYLVCDQARRGVKCSYISFKCNELESTFLSYCKEIDMHSVLQIEGDKDQQKLAELVKQKSAMEGELLSLEHQINLTENTLASLDEDAMKYAYTRLGKLSKDKANIEVLIKSITNGIGTIQSSISDADSKVENIASIFGMICDSSSENDRILLRARLRNELRQIVKKVVVYPRGNIFSSEDIERLTNKHMCELKNVAEAQREALQDAFEFELYIMQSSQENTKENRYFTVWFKNGNYRHFRYSNKDGKYHVTSERIGDKVNWWIRGTKMKTIDLVDDVNAEIEQIMKDNPENDWNDANIGKLREYLQIDE